ncbi:hypothetical protein GOBAR_DD34511 [Gossypium barbadense]|nr:hypothetical protein GOBAR_DD34511 [Gossypium barbadense]
MEETLSLEQVTEDQILKWKCCIAEALNIKFHVDFAATRLIEIVKSYLDLIARSRMTAIDERIKALEMEMNGLKCEKLEIDRNPLSICSGNVILSRNYGILFILTLELDLLNGVIERNGSRAMSLHKCGWWKPPLPGWVKLNSDGSSISNPGKASVEVELWMLRDGLILACDLNIENLEIEVDEVFIG